MDPEEVLQFWFGKNPDDPKVVAERCKLWFGHSQVFDDLIRRRFGDLPFWAAEEGFSSWQKAARSSLALVLGLDQFPRNIFRGTHRSFAFDPLAVKAVKGAIACGFDQKVHPVEAAFFYFPLEHAEDLVLQQQSVEHFGRLVEQSPRQLLHVFEGFLDYAERHFAVIYRFGRFPHRNGLLGRASTKEEAIYLAEGGETFGGAIRKHQKGSD